MRLRVKGVYVMAENFGDELKRLREAAGFESQSKLASISGVDNSTIARLERGETKPTPETLKKLAPYLYVPYETLMKLAGHLPGEIEIVREAPKEPLKVDLLNENIQFYWRGRPLTEEEVEDIRIGQEARELWKKKQREKQQEKK